MSRALDVEKLEQLAALRLLPLLLVFPLFPLLLYHLSLPLSLLPSPSLSFSLQLFSCLHLLLLPTLSTLANIFRANFGCLKAKPALPLLAVPAASPCYLFLLPLPSTYPCPAALLCPTLPLLCLLYIALMPHHGKHTCQKGTDTPFASLPPSLPPKYPSPLPPISLSSPSHSPSLYPSRFSLSPPFPS